MDKEYAIVCELVDQDGHTAHRWAKPTEARAIQSAINATHRAQLDRTPCKQFRVQVRTVTPWGDLDE